MNPKKISVGLLLTVFLAFVLGASFITPIQNTIDEAKDKVFSVSSDSEFEVGTLTNLTTSDGLVLESTETAGTYESQIYETTGTDWNETTVTANITNSTDSSVSVTVEFSDDGFSTVKDSTTTTLSDGANTVDLSGYDSQDVRVKLDLSRTGTSVTTPEVESFEATGTTAGAEGTLLGLVVLFFVVGLIVYGAKSMMGV